MAQIQLPKNIVKMFNNIQINGIDYKTEETTVSPSAQQILAENRESAQNILQSSIEQEIGQEVKAVELNETLHNVKDESARNNILKEVSTRASEITRVEGLIESEVSTRASEITRVEGLIESEASTRASTDATLNNNINTINSKIPSQASSTNQLADKDFVNSSIATNTANFIGTFTDIEDLKRQPATNNDYAFWLTTDSAGNILFKRYKYIASTNSWVFEYDLNNSSFTSEQWLAIQSGITAVLVAKLKGIEEGAQVNTITGVKGGNESSYRTGNVNITKDNVGLGNVVNTGDSAIPTSGGTTKFTTGGAYTELAKKNDKITITDDSSTALTDADTFSTTGNTGTNPTNLTKRPLSLLWTYIKDKADSVYAKLSHTHTKSQITDFPTSLPANGGIADTATSAISVVDYGDTSKTIQIGYKGPGASIDDLAYIAGYLTGGTQIKDVSKDTLKSWLGLGSAPSFSQFCPNLSKIKGVTLPFTIPEDGWILSIKADKDIQISIKIDGFTDTINVLPHQMYLGQFHDTKSNTDKKVVVPSMICPFPVRKGQVIASVDTQGAKVTITFTPCIGNQN